MVWSFPDENDKTAFEEYKKNSIDLTKDNHDKTPDNYWTSGVAIFNDDNIFEYTINHPIIAGKISCDNCKDGKVCFDLND